MTDPFKNRLDFFKNFKENESEISPQSVDPNFKFNRDEAYNRNFFKSNEALRGHNSNHNSEFVNQLKSNFELLFKAAG